MLTLAGTCRYEEVIKRSRFIAHASRVRTQAESLEFYDSVMDAQATHNCWAWRINYQVRFNDDGEPSSSAGRPILASIEGRELDQVMIVVTRHFGGIKLGVGGLVRAYGGTAAKCLDRARIVEIVPSVTCRLEADFALAGAVHQLLDRFNVQKKTEDYVGAGLSLQIRLPSNRLADFEEALAEASRGQASLKRI